MRPEGCPLPPSSSLPPLRNLDALTEIQVSDALRNLCAIYRPLAVTLTGSSEAAKDLSASQTLVDSGYTSATEDDAGPEATENALTALRADDFERGFAERWLTGFLARAEGAACFRDDEAALQHALDQASSVLESFYNVPTFGDNDDDDNDHNNGDGNPAESTEPDLYAREFSFPVNLPLSLSTSTPTPKDATKPVSVRLNDGLAGTDSSDPDDVGLQSWSGAVVLSELMCADPERFGLVIPGKSSSGPEFPSRVVELGAGTGLVSLALGALLPRLGDAGKNTQIVATDYHPAVLANLRANVALNVHVDTDAAAALAPVEACLLDWSTLVLHEPLDDAIPADLVVATDVIYAPEHALWLRKCAAKVLAPGGTFWMLIAIRRKGRFEDLGITNMVERTFAKEDEGETHSEGAVFEDGKKLVILETETMEKRKGFGRGDESGYKLYKIGWA